MRARRQARRMAVRFGAMLVVMGVSASGAAQDLPLAQVLPDLVLREIVLQRGALGPSHQAHFSPLTNDLNNPVVGIVESFNTQMATQFSTFPLGSSTGGLTYVFDESIGTFRRGSASFGPLFGERALTIGRRKLSVGFNYQRASYDTFEGQNLDDGSIKFYLRHQDCCTFRLVPEDPYFVFSSRMGDGSRLTPPFEGDIIEAALSLRATTHTTALFANYGITDRWDVGLAVPFLRVNLDASVRARIIRLVTEGFEAHTFEVGNLSATRTVQHSGNASGLGDVVVRSKYRLLRSAGGGLAAAVDLRLPTGDKDNLLGAGGTQAKLLLVASDERGRLGRHVNMGYTIASGSVPGTLAGLISAPLPDEFNYSGGVEFVASPRFTVNGDFIGRTLRGAGRLDLASKPFQYTVPPPGVRPEDVTPQLLVELGYLSRPLPSATAFFDELDPRQGNLTLLLGSGGIKVNLAGNLLVSGSVLFPLTNAGLRSRVTTVVGVDYAF